MLTIGTLYAHGYCREQITIIQSLGFALRPSASYYAGSQKLRFIDFPTPPTLELIQVEDGKEYAGFLPPGMEPYCPGISIEVNPNTSAMLEKYKVAFAGHKPYILHVDESGGNDQAKPGTNYLNFSVPLVEKTFIYLTQSDLPEPEPSPVLPHANKASGVSGLVFDLPREALASLFSLWGQAPSDALPTLGGIKIYAQEHIPEALRRKKKAFPLAAVVVSAENPIPNRNQDVIHWLGGSALLVEMNSLSWDIILTT
jgi:hypothetical protein